MTTQERLELLKANYTDFGVYLHLKDFDGRCVSYMDFESDEVGVHRIEMASCGCCVETVHEKYTLEEFLEGLTENNFEELLEYFRNKKGTMDD